jgi:hypothetical protein
VSGGLAENGLGIPGNHKLRGSLRYTFLRHVISFLSRIVNAVNMDEVKSPKFIWVPSAQLYSLAETPQLPPHFGSYVGAISQPR